MKPSLNPVRAVSASSQAGSRHLPILLRRAARPLTIAYHELSPEPTTYSYALSLRQFEEHLQLAKLLQKHSPDREPPFAISFDDGHISNYTYALPLLQKYSLKAIFFVIVGRIGQHRDSMTWAHLREIASLGHRVEAHSWSHSFLTECSESELRDDLKRSRDSLEAHLGKAPAALSAPHGRWNQRVLNACAQTGFRQLYTSDPCSPARASGRVQVIGRLVMVQSMDANRLLHWLAMSPGEAGLRRAQYALKRSAQRMLGNKLYYSLWSRLSGWNGLDDTVVTKNQ